MKIFIRVALISLFYSSSSIALTINLELDDVLSKITSKIESLRTQAAKQKELSKFENELGEILESLYSPLIFPRDAKKLSWLREEYNKDLFETLKDLDLDQFYKLGYKIRKERLNENNPSFYNKFNSKYKEDVIKVVSAYLKALEENSLGNNLLVFWSSSRLRKFVYVTSFGSPKPLKPFCSNYEISKALEFEIGKVKVVSETKAYVRIRVQDSKIPIEAYPQTYYDFDSNYKMFLILFKENDSWKIHFDPLKIPWDIELNDSDYIRCAK